MTTLTVFVRVKTAGNTCNIPMTTLTLFVIHYSYHPINTVSVVIDLLQVFTAVITVTNTVCCHRYATGIHYSHHPNKIPVTYL
jgi:hypothetical protein